jgi:hypothetical protein
LKRAVMLVAAVVAVTLLSSVASAAGSNHPGAPAKPKVHLRLLSIKQNEILSSHELRVRVTRSGRAQSKKPPHVKLQGFSKSFDNTRFRSITPKSKEALRHRKQTFTLKLTDSSSIRGCAARTLRVRAGEQEVSEPMLRTGACAPQPIDLSRSDDCDFIGQQSGSLCMLPFPDDYYTKSDSSSATGRLVDFHLPAMPDNAANTHIDPAPYALNDGFSPGETILVRVPGLDTPAALAATHAAPVNHIGQYERKKAPVVVIDTVTGERVPIWVELDSNAGSSANTLLEIHPAVNYASGDRYIVAMRNLRDGDDKVIKAPEGFRYYRDALPAKKAAITSRKGHFAKIFRTLRDAGIDRSDLYLAWDFTVASDENIADRALHIRDDAFGSLGDEDMADGTVSGLSPNFQVTGTDVPADPQIARRVTGTFTVPCYMQPNCNAGGKFDLDSNGLPQRNGNYTANFICIVPQVAVGAPGPQLVRPAIYGHGLFGSAGEVYGSPTNRDLADQYGFVMCATDEIGMSGGDVGNTAANILPDLSKFPQLADRLQQGLLNELFLSRLMIHPNGFSSAAAFHQDGTLSTPSVIDTSQNYYVGASQGGIMGGALTALAPDFTRSVLNVPAMNYSVLLPRSVDYDQFAVFINAQYSEMERPLALDLIQMLWDRGEPNGYAHRMTDTPLAETPAHKVLMNIALGDHQVTNFQADVEARTIGASTREPILYPGRWPDVDVMWNVPRIATFPFDGSAAIYGDIGPVRDDPMNPGHSIGVPPPPLTNTPNRLGEDPHGAPRGAPQAVHLISDFLKPTGAVTNVCGATACFAGGFTGP